MTPQSLHGSHSLFSEGPEDEDLAIRSTGNRVVKLEVMGPRLPVEVALHLLRPSATIQPISSHDAGSLSGI